MIIALDCYERSCVVRWRLGISGFETIVKMIIQAGGTRSLRRVPYVGVCDYLCEPLCLLAPGIGIEWQGTAD